MYAAAECRNKSESVFMLRRTIGLNHGDANIARYCAACSFGIVASIGLSV